MLDVKVFVEDGNLDGGFAASDHVYEGEFQTGLQEHFYLEPHAALAIPRMECGEMDVYVTSQCLLASHVGQSICLKKLFGSYKKGFCR